MYITAINRAQRLATTNTGTACAVAAWIDEGGEETDDASAAVVAVVPLPNGKWETVDLRDFDAVEVH